MAEAVERVRAAAESRNVQIEVHEPPESVTVLADRRQLVSALYNLLENAVKFSYDGGNVRFGAEVHGGTVEVWVVDRGVGHSGARPRPDLRALLPRRPGPEPPDRRHRARTVDRAPRGRQPRRQRGGRLPRGGGLDVPPEPAAADHGRRRGPGGGDGSEPTVVAPAGAGRIRRTQERPPRPPSRPADALGAAGRGRRVLRRRAGRRAGPRGLRRSPWPATATRPWRCSRDSIPTWYCST